MKKIAVLILVCCFGIIKSGAQNWSEVFKSSSNDGAEEDFFGKSVCISGDGNTVLVGAYSKDVGSATNQGEAYIFSRSGNTWSEDTILLASNGSDDDNFGFSVSLSYDGNTAIIAAHHKEDGVKNLQGAVYVFARTNGVWTEKVILMPSDAAYGDNFGYNISLSADGNRFIVGAPRKIVGSNSQQGKAYIYLRSGNTWVEEAIFTAADGAENNFFGWATHISGDGNTALVGAIGHGAASSYLGKAYVYTRSGSVWSLQGALLPSDPEYNCNYANALCLSYNGNTALVGAPDKTITGGDPQQGKVYVYTRSGNTWSQQAGLVTTAGKALDRFGVAVTLSSDGNQAFIGSNVDDKGMAYQFTRSDQVWTEQSSFAASDAAQYDFFGQDLSVSADGNTLLICAYNKTENYNNQGKIYIFYNTTTTATQKANNVETGLAYFPNPTTGYVLIKLETPSEQLDVELLSAQGKVLAQKRFINCSDFEWELPDENGMYFLHLKNNNRYDRMLKVLKY